VDETAVSPDQPLDTAEDAYAVQLEAYRRLGGAERVAIVFRLNALVRQMAIAGIRTRHPNYDDAQVRMALQRLMFGDAVVRSAFPDGELVDP
jgi:hypothetical protein